MDAPGQTDEEQFRHFHQYFRQTSPGVIPLRSALALDRYEDAIDAYTRDGNRSALLRELLAIGLSAKEVRWHAANPGKRMVCAAPG